MKLLIVDDSKAMQTIVTRILHKAGYKENEFKTALDGKAAFEIVCNWRPDVVLTDWHMPEMNGLELMHAIVRSGIQTKVGVITTEKSRKRIAQAKAAGAVFVVHKPFETEQLERAIIPLLGNADEDDVELENDTLPSIVLPNASAVSKILNCLSSSPIKITDVTEEPFNISNLPFEIALYDDQNGKIKTVCMLNHTAACYIGGSLSGYSEEKVLEAVASKTIPRFLFDNSKKILSMFSALFYDHEFKKDLNIYATHLIHKPFNRLEEFQKRPPHKRVHLKIAVEGYGTGAIYFALA